MSSPTPPKKEPKELSNEVRMLLAFVLMGLILVVTPYVYRKLGLAPPQRVRRRRQTAKDAGAPPSSAADTASGTPMSPSSARYSGGSRG